MALLEVEQLRTVLKGKVIHDGISFSLEKGEILGVVGGSGSGKSVLLRVILGLLPKKDGVIRAFETDLRTASARSILKKRSGVLFQSGALFSSLTVGENIRLPMIEIGGLSSSLARDLSYVRLSMVGLPFDTEGKYPSELSGGMVKRAALARALALEAEILFLDEPTAGLDPISAEGFDTLLKNLQRDLGLSVIMVTHDLDSLRALCDRVAVLVDQKIIIGTLEELKKQSHPWIQSYFSGKRGRAVWKGDL